ncbi:hypothetical protein PanWU01x14_196760 [Parasponia andersonii]|uniref:Uncharacterized protein n=1 Tax=Parasponia andersonii TaxID=3476 RepID=A0A2P5BZ98_PARAD|nr:hypothetical protein PanWU01x14_196760 [Parasponia andersonii]
MKVKNTVHSTTLVHWIPNMLVLGRMKLESPDGRKQEEAMLMSTELKSMDMTKGGLGSMAIEEGSLENPQSQVFLPYLMRSKQL